MSEEIKRFEQQTGHAAWINSDIYPDGKIYTKQFTEYIQSENKRLRDENERLTKQNKFLKTAGENLVEDNRSHQNEINRLRESLKTGEDANYKLIDKVRLLREGLEESKILIEHACPAWDDTSFRYEQWWKRQRDFLSKHKDL